MRREDPAHDVPTEHEQGYPRTVRGNIGSVGYLRGHHYQAKNRLGTSMTEDQITMLRDLSTHISTGHLLYYYQGNFYYPLDLAGADRGRVKRAIRNFKRNHAAMVENDRADPNYKTIVQISFCYQLDNLD